MTSLMKYFTLPYPCFLWVLLYNNNADIIFLLMFGLFFPFSKTHFRKHEYSVKSQLNLLFTCKLYSSRVRL